MIRAEAEQQIDGYIDVVNIIYGAGVITVFIEWIPTLLQMTWLFLMHIVIFHHCLVYHYINPNNIYICRLCQII